MYFRQDWHIAWALVLSLAVHAVLLFFSLQFAPWKAGQVTAGEPIQVQLKTGVEAAGKQSRTEQDLQRIKPATTQTATDHISEAGTLFSDQTEQVETTPDEKSWPTTGTIDQSEPAEQQPELIINSASPENLRAGPNSGSQSEIDYQAYTETLRKTIEKNKRYPVMAFRGRQQGTVLVSFTLHHDGKLVKCRVTRSCGYQLLDRAALRAVQTTDRYPPFPDSLTLKQTDFVVPVTFKIDNQ